MKAKEGTYVGLERPGGGVGSGDEVVGVQERRTEDKK